MAIKIALPSNTSVKKGTTVVSGMDTLTFGLGSVEDVDISHFESPGDYREFLSGMKDGGEVTMAGKADYADPGQLAILADAGSAPIPTDTYSFEIAEDVVYSFTGYPRPPELGATMNNPYAASYTFKVTGKPTLTAGGVVIF